MSSGEGATGAGLQGSLERERSSLRRELHAHRQSPRPMRRSVDRAAGVVRGETLRNVPRDACVRTAVPLAADDVHKPLLHVRHDAAWCKSASLESSWRFVPGTRSGCRFGSSLSDCGVQVLQGMRRERQPSRGGEERRLASPSASAPYRLTARLAVVGDWWRPNRTLLFVQPQFAVVFATQATVAARPGDGQSVGALSGRILPHRLNRRTNGEYATLPRWQSGSAVALTDRGGKALGGGQRRNALRSSCVGPRGDETRRVDGR